jgi:hypothetical protein
MSPGRPSKQEDVRVLYHGTDVRSARSIEQTGLQWDETWTGLPENHWTLTVSESDAWTLARIKSGKTGEDPAVVMCRLPEELFDEYVFPTPLVLHPPDVIYYALRKPVPAAMTEWHVSGETR